MKCKNELKNLYTQPYKRGLSLIMPESKEFILDVLVIADDIC